MGLYLTTNEVKLLQGRKNLKRAQEDLAMARRSKLTNMPWTIAQAERAVCICLDKVAGYQRSVEAERIHREPARQQRIETLFGIKAGHPEPVWVTPRRWPEFAADNIIPHQYHG